MAKADVVIWGEATDDRRAGELRERRPNAPAGRKGGCPHVPFDHWVAKEPEEQAKDLRRE